MRFAPLLCVTILLASAALLWAGAAPEGWGIVPGAPLVLAVVCIELALAPLMFLPATGRDRAVVASNAAWFVACWLACSAAVMLLEFASPGSPALATRPLSVSAWLAAGGALALSAAISPQGPRTVRPLLLALFGLPALLHYLSLEYAGASQAGLAAVSPHWLLARGETGMAWWLGGLGLLCWVATAAICLRRRVA